MNFWVYFGTFWYFLLLLGTFWVFFSTFLVFFFGHFWVLLGDLRYWLTDWLKNTGLFNRIFKRNSKRSALIALPCWRLQSTFSWIACLRRKQDNANMLAVQCVYFRAQGDICIYQAPGMYTTPRTRSVKYTLAPGVWITHSTRTQLFQSPILFRDPEQTNHTQI